MSAFKYQIIPAILLVGATTLAHAAELESLEQRFSYVLGYQFAQQIKGEGMRLDATSLAAAVEDVMDGKPLRMSMQEMQAALTERRSALIAQKQAKAEAAIAAGEAFLEQNKQKEGVQVLESGLQYKVLQAGTGDSPTAESTVTVHYRGKLIDGTEFDSSYGRGEPTSFGLGGVIPGFRESLTRMNKGAKWQVFIPSEMGYGAKGAGSSIGPNETLIFEIELISFE
jgi:FKBP-type peptidyl-prolyl cis-trans isomerase